MMEIKMERSEWMFQAMKNSGFLPANQKYKKTTVINNELQKKIEGILSGELKRPITELKTLLEGLKKERIQMETEQPNGKARGCFAVKRDHSGQD